MKKEAEILIVEDEVLSAMSLQQDLKRSGYKNCRYVTTGEEALDEMDEGGTELIIMDISLGGKLTGIETAGILLSNHDIPVILVSGYNYEDFEEKIAGMENVHFLKKPIRKTALIKLMDGITQ